VSELPQKPPVVSVKPYPSRSCKPRSLKNSVVSIGMAAEPETIKRTFSQPSLRLMLEKTSRSASWRRQPVFCLRAQLSTLALMPLPACLSISALMRFHTRGTPRSSEGW
jgi:hypothetical protein